MENLSRNERRILEKAPGNAVYRRREHAEKDAQRGYGAYRNVFQRRTFFQRRFRLDGHDDARQLLRFGNVEPLRLGDQMLKKGAEKI